MTRPDRAARPDVELISQAERFRTGANTHWLSGMLWRYKNPTSQAKQDEYATYLQKFVNTKGVGREMTKQEIDAVYEKMGWKR